MNRADLSQEQAEDQALRRAQTVFSAARARSLKAGVSVTELKGRNIVEVLPSGEVREVAAAEAWVKVRVGRHERAKR